MLIAEGYTNIISSFVACLFCRFTQKQFENTLKRFKYVKKTTIYTMNWYPLLLSDHGKTMGHIRFLFPPLIPMNIRRRSVARTSIMDEKLTACKRCLFKTSHKCLNDIFNYICFSLSALHFRWFKDVACKIELSS